MKKHQAKVRTLIQRDLGIGIVALVLTCFFLSGLTGLIYEILWMRMIIKVVGTAPFAVSIVLTVFMGGLGLGSFLAGRMIDQVQTSQRLLRIYALLELAIGACGILLPSLIRAVEPIHSLLYNHLFHHFLLFNFLTLIGCILLFFVPAMCMGATLPVLCRFYIFKLGHLGTRAGRLYALNTIGAAGGSILCGFWLLNAWGVTGTLIFAVLLNGLIGLACLLASYYNPTGLFKMATGEPILNDTTQVSTLPDPAQTSPLPPEAVGALIIFTVSGFCAMAYEVIWTRLLGLIIGPTTYSFTIVLATFIVGLALGSLIFGRLADRIKNPLWLLVLIQLGAGFAVLGASQIMGNSQFFFAKLIYIFKNQFVELSLVKAGVLFGLMLGPTLCLGATFPLVGKIYSRSAAFVGKSLGFAYAYNTLGAVLGSFMAGFMLIPYLGKEHSLRLVIGIQLLTAVLVGAYLLRKTKATKARWIVLGMALLVGLIFCLNYPFWNRQQLSIGRYQRFEELDSQIKNTSWLKSLWQGSELLAQYQTNTELVYYGDGIGGFTTVFKETDALGTAHFVLANSGKPDASSRADMPTQTLATHLPLLFHPNPKSVMVLGLASGVTAGEVLYYPIEQLDVIEISEQVIAASNFFKPWNNNVLTDPRTKLILQDGRTHIALTDQNYDVIISEPSNPWMAGLANLFTEDFFLLAKNRLNPDGIFVQFFHSYQMDWSTFALAGRTFEKVFPNSILVTTSLGGNDFLMVGFNGKDRLSVNNAEKNIVYAQKSKNITLSDPKVLYRLIVSEDLKTLFGPGPVHSDNQPRLEFAAPKQMYTDDPSIENTIRSQKWLSQETKNILKETENVGSQIAFAAYTLSVYQPFENMVDLSGATPAQKEQFFYIIENYCARSLINDYSIFTNQELKKSCLDLQTEHLQQNINLVPNQAPVYNSLGNAYFAGKEFFEAIKLYQKSLLINPDSIATRNALGMAYWKAGLPDEAVAEYNQVLAIDPGQAEANTNLGNIYLEKGEFDQAISLLKKALESKPGLAAIHYNLGIAYFSQGKLNEAIAEYKKAVALRPNYVEAINNLGRTYAATGNLNDAVTAFHRVLAVKPDYAEANNNLGSALGIEGLWDESIAAFERAVTLKPDYAEAYNSLGAAYSINGRVDDAIGAFEQAVSVKPDYAEAYNNLGGAYAIKGRLNDAITALEQAANIRPDYAEVYNNLGKAYGLKGRWDDAIGAFEEAIALKPDYGPAHYGLAQYYYLKKNYKLSLWHNDKALKLGMQADPKLQELLEPYR
ncbi:hypothetical protein COV49_04580 [Candidatus Falkowbacteria bacterium CG11_big_fil_rev_8_21_14_0_20_39_10]|uniref:Polyamine aminopropyltransferase n=1 Tax=Candidatus Falkowbacteria bacterium CG11_big_fil_rev_8_21_14_0_20_39_10 TaxID=1974570 RepID=A0A2M6K7V4_9BACT|nr:MAG: hypothetical protein COV49_04580 [Candidatus Falkowbacteria bacterium CG11_big_fil_rev_8_21_14_0_20_39_10]